MENNKKAYMYKEMNEESKYSRDKRNSVDRNTGSGFKRSGLD